MNWDSIARLFPSLILAFHIDTCVSDSKNCCQNWISKRYQKVYSISERIYIDTDPGTFLHSSFDPTYDVAHSVLSRPATRLTNSHSSLCVFHRRSTYNHLSSWLTDARNLTNPNTVSMVSHCFSLAACQTHCVWLDVLPSSHSFLHSLI